MTDPILDPPGAVPALPSEPLLEKLLDAEQTYRQNMRSRAFVASWDSYAYTANLLRDARKALAAATQERDDYIAQHDVDVAGLCRVVDGLRDQLASAAAHISAIWAFVEHRRECATLRQVSQEPTGGFRFVWPDPDSKCTCGLDQILSSPSASDQEKA